MLSNYKFSLMFSWTQLQKHNIPDLPCILLYLPNHLSLCLCYVYWTLCLHKICFFSVCTHYYFYHHQFKLCKFTSLLHWKYGKATNTKLRVCIYCLLTSLFWTLNGLAVFTLICLLGQLYFSWKICGKFLNPHILPKSSHWGIST